jgi:hypothetical protein
MLDKKVVNHEAKEYFERWYVKPLKVLASIPNGDGGFIVLATCCYLYERYADAVINEAKKKPNDRERITQLTTDFGIDQETAKIFWEVVRNGILHKGMPKQKDRSQKTLPQWRFRHEFPQPIKLIKMNNQPFELQVQPWLFMNKVINLCEKNLDFLDRNDSFPWAKIILNSKDSSEVDLSDNRGVPGTTSHKKESGYSMETGSTSGLQNLLRNK